MQRIYCTLMNDASIYFYLLDNSKSAAGSTSISSTLLLWLERYGLFRGCPRGEMVKAMDCGIIVSEFVLQSYYYLHYQENTLGKGMNPLVLPAMG